MTFTNYPGATFDITRTYDLSQNLKTVTRGGSVWTYSYDNAEQLTREKLDIDGRSYNTHYTLNLLGVPTEMNTAGGRIVTFSPNGLGQATVAASGGVNYASSIDYHESGGLKDLTYGNGTILTHACDARQLLTEIKLRDGATPSLFANLYRAS